jgi:molecular chaperone DnaJ
VSTKDYLEKDYYKTLGVAKTAKPAEVKTAYRKLARKYHPDSNQGDAKAEERFKEISEAYSVLSDEKRRKEYDEARSLFGSGRAAAAGSTSTSVTSSAGPGTRVAAWATCSAPCSTAAATATPRRTGRGGAPTWRPRPR